MYLTSLYLIVASLTIPQNDGYFYYANVYKPKETLLNSDTIKIDLNIETVLYAESNDFIDFTVADETTVYNQNKSFQVSAPNIKDYNFIQYSFNVDNAKISYNQDFISGSYDLRCGVYVSNTNTGDYKTSNQYYTIKFEYAYIGGTYGGLGDAQMSKTSEFRISGNLYLNTDSPAYTNGFEAGYNAGIIAERQEHPIFKVFNAVFNVIDNVLSVEILPNIKLWYLLGIPFFFLVLQFVLNLFR